MARPAEEEEEDLVYHVYHLYIFFTGNTVCLGAPLPVNSVHVDVRLLLSSPALVQLALHAVTDAPEDPNHSCQEAQHDHDVGRDRSPGEGDPSVLEPQVDPATGQHTSPHEEDGVSPSPQMLPNIHDLSLGRELSRETGPTFRSPDE